MRVSALSLLVPLALGGCVIREVPAGSQPAAPPPAAAPPAAAPPAAAPPAAAPPVAAAPPAPGLHPQPAPKPGTQLPGPAVPPKPGAPTTVAGGPPIKFTLPPPMKGNNSFGSSNAVAGSIQGLVYDIPVNSTALPNFSTLTPFGHLYSTSWDIAPRDFKEGFPGLGDKVEWFAIRWEGKVTAKAAGGHLFRIKSDDGARLFLDGQRIIDNDGTHPPKDATGQANLAAGEHNLVIEYFQGPKYQIALQIWVTSPGVGEKIMGTTF